MDRDKIKRTTVCRREDGHFVAWSPLFRYGIGAGETEAEALRVFNEIVNDAYIEYLEGNLKHDKPGRPSKNGVIINTQIQVDTKNGIASLAASMELSQGEVIDYLYAYREAHESTANVPTKDKRRA